MNRNSNRTNWFFPIEEAPVFTTVTRSGESLNVRVPHKKALIAADTGDIVSNNTMTDIAARPPQSPRFRRNRPTLERRAGAWLRDFRISPARASSGGLRQLSALGDNPKAWYDLEDWELKQVIGVKFIEYGATQDGSRIPGLVRALPSLLSRILRSHWQKPRLSRAHPVTLAAPRQLYRTYPPRRVITYFFNGKCVKLAIKRRFFGRVAMFFEISAPGYKIAVGIARRVN